MLAEGGFRRFEKSNEGLGLISGGGCHNNGCGSHRDVGVTEKVSIVGLLVAAGLMNEGFQRIREGGRQGWRNTTAGWPDGGSGGGRLEFESIQKAKDEVGLAAAVESWGGRLAAAKGLGRRRVCNYKLINNITAPSTSFAATAPVVTTSSILICRCRRRNTYSCSLHHQPSSLPKNKFFKKYQKTNLSLPSSLNPLCFSKPQKLVTKNLKGMATTMTGDLSPPSSLYPPHIHQSTYLTPSKTRIFFLPSLYFFAHVTF